MLTLSLLKKTSVHKPWQENISSWSEPRAADVKMFWLDTEMTKGGNKVRKPVRAWLACMHGLQTQYVFPQINFRIHPQMGRAVISMSKLESSLKIRVAMDNMSKPCRESKGEKGGGGGGFKIPRESPRQQPRAN